MIRALAMGGICFLLASSVSYAQDSVPGQGAAAALTNDAASPPEPAPACRDACCCPCGPPGRFWVSGQYLLWTTRGDRLPPLVTSAPANSPAFNPGALGNPDTTVLFGNQSVGGTMRSGIWLRGGFWLDDCHRCGLEADYFYLTPGGKSFGAAGGANGDILGRPAFDTSLGIPGIEYFAGPSPLGPNAGGIFVSDQTGFSGGSLNARHQLCCCDQCGKGYRIDLLGGYRTLYLRDDLKISENINELNLDGSLAANIQVFDRFRTKNWFNGVQLGVAGEWYWKRFFVRGRGLAALGVTHQTVDIEGATVNTVPGAGSAAFPGGFLALPTNIGHYTRDRFTFAPELDLQVGYWITPRLRASVGYTFIYWSNVARAGAQVDPTVNPYYIPPAPPPPGLSPTPARPAFYFHGSDFWAQGVTFGLELRF